MTSLMVDDGTRLAYQLDGPPDAPAVLFLNSLGCDLRNLTSTIKARSLVIGGELDVATPPAQAEDLHAAIVPSELMVIPSVAHRSNLEAPELFTRRLRELLTGP